MATTKTCGACGTQFVPSPVSLMLGLRASEFRCDACVDEGNDGEEDEPSRRASNSGKYSGETLNAYNPDA